MAKIKTTKVKGYLHVLFRVPSESGVVMLPLDKNHCGPYGAIGHSWTWDGNVDAPTLSPSVNGHTHFWIRNGVVEYCDDPKNPPEFRKVNLPMPDLEWAADIGEREDE